MSAISGRRHDGEIRGWLAVAALAFGTFVMVTSEFLPIGLLPNIARDLHTSDGTAGLMVTIPGLIAAIAAPTLVVISGKLDRRYLLWLLSGLLVISNLIAATAGSLPVMLLGRVLLGISVGGFWGFGAALAGRMVDPQSGGRAVTMVFAGISIGTVLGMPAGAFVGHAAGWRVAFFTAAELSVAVLVAQVFLLPLLPVLELSKPRQLSAVFAIPAVRIGLICVVLVILGHFMAYTYVTPYLEIRAGTPSASISIVLLAYGTAGFVGNLVAGSLVQRNARAVLAAFALLLGVALIVLPYTGTNVIATAIAIVLWGFAFGGIPVSLQTWMLRAAPDSMSGISAIFVSVFQLALAAGALVGGASVASLGLSTTMALGGATAVAAGLVILGFGRIRSAQVAVVSAS